MKLNIHYEDAALKSLQKRAKIFYFILGFLFLLLMMRLFYLQIIQGSALYTFSEKNLLKEIRVQAPRGIVYDRNNQILAENLPNFALTVSPQYIKKLDIIAEALAPILKEKKENILTIIKKGIRANGPYNPVIVKNFLSRDEIQKIELLKIEYQGLDIEELIFRSYPHNDMLAHALGNVGEISENEYQKMSQAIERNLKKGDIIGKSGLEEKYDTTLRGQPGTSFVKVDARGREAIDESLKFLGHIEDLNPVSGVNMVTTLDFDLQKAAYEAFQKHEQTGALVAISKTGEVLALVNNPGFNPNNFSKGLSMEEWSSLVNNPTKPLRNRAIQDHYSPGSTFKPFVALAALQTKALTENTLVNAPPFIMFGGRAYHDHTKTGQGNINVIQAIEMSSNVFFYKQGLKLGVDKVALYTKALGLGAKTNIDLNREATGLIPTSQWKKEKYGEPWQEGENLSIAVGQGYVLLTPLQLASGYMSIANNGMVYKPYLVKEIFDPIKKTSQTFEPQLVRNVNDPKEPYYISEAAFATVKKGLHAVANGKRGTAAWAKVPGFTLAGKTGTVQVRGYTSDQVYGNCLARPRKQRHHGWYVAFGPYEDPEITVAVLTEHSCSSKAAVPIVRDFYNAYALKYHPSAVAAAEEKKNVKK